MLTAMKGLPDVDGLARSAYASEIELSPETFWDSLYYDPACVFSLD